jgi:hypothetical protein
LHRKIKADDLSLLFGHLLLIHEVGVDKEIGLNRKIKPVLEQLVNENISLKK